MISMKIDFADLLRALGRILGVGCRDQRTKPWNGPVNRVIVEPHRFFIENPNLEICPMDIVNVTIPALAWRGVQPGLHFYFGEREVFPPASRAVVSVENSEVATAEYQDDGPLGPRINIYPLSSAAEGATTRVSLSMDDTGPNEDIVLNVTIGPFAITSTTIAAPFNVEMFEPAAEPPTEPAPAPEPAPEEVPPENLPPAA